MKAGARAPARAAPGYGEPRPVPVPAALRPWREVLAPWPEIADGGRRGEFAADLGLVLAGRAAAEYQDPAAFFARTHLNRGLRDLLAGALARLAGRGGAPVVLLRTAFGGGKTHALLALYHLASGSSGEGRPPVPVPDGPEGAADLGPTVAARAAALVGSELSAAQPWPCRWLAGRPVRTLWGELSAQLGGTAGYERLRQADEQAMPPSAPELAELLAACGPALVLVDELVPFARALLGSRGPSAGSFDANLTFVHNLTEAVRRSDTALLVLTAPAGAAEAGGAAGGAALDRLLATVGRVQAPRGLAAEGDGSALVRRRLFPPASAAAEREAAATCQAFSRMYAGRAAAFPGEAGGADYGARLRATYPVHPELLDRLAAWTALPGFQGPRGVLRLAAAAVRELWRRGDDGPLVLPGSMPLDAPEVRDELVRCLDAGWKAVVEAEVDGSGSVPAALDREDVRLAPAAAARRVARALLLGSPAACSGQARGLDDPGVHLGVVHPGEPLAPFDEALSRLRARLAHLHGDGRRLWYDPRPNLNGAAADRAARVEAWQVEEEVRRLIRRGERGDFAAVHVVPARNGADGGDVPDVPEARLVVLPLSHPHRAAGSAAAEPPAGGPPAAALAAEVLERPGVELSADSPAADAAADRLAGSPAAALAAEVLERRGVDSLADSPAADAAADRLAGSPAAALAAEVLERRANGRPRRFRNALVFAAADAASVATLERAARRLLAWQSVVDDAVRGGLELDPSQRRAARDAARQAAATLEQDIREAYRWLLVPVQEGSGPVGWDLLALPGGDGIAARASRRLGADGLLITRWSPVLLRRELDRWLWRDRPHVGLREAWEALASYCYLPRLRDAGVLLAAVGEALRGDGPLAYADGLTEAGGYVGLRRDGGAGGMRLDRAALLVRPDAAAAQQQRAAGEGEAGVAQCGDEVAEREGDVAEHGAGVAERGAGLAERGAGVAEHEGGGSGGRSRPRPAAATPTPPPRSATRRFRGSVAWEPLRSASDVARVAEEVLIHLVSADGARIAVRLDISADADGLGLPADVVRTLRENCRALGFDVAEFEEG